MTAHAVLAPSAAPQWGNCSGSVTASLSVGNTDSTSSREGTAAHWVGSECLDAWRTPGAMGIFCEDWLGRTAPNGVVITAKMVEGAQIYVDDVAAVAGVELGGLLVEHKVSMPRVHAQNWGTLDCGLVSWQRRKVIIWDYKHGHREVRAKGNLQLIDYLEGVSHAAKLDDQEWTFEIRIVQPFAYSPRGAVDSWSGNLSDIRSWVNLLGSKADEAMADPKMSAGAWCRDCPAVGKCATARRAGYSLLSYLDEPYAIETMTGQDLATERKMLLVGMALAKARLEAVDADLCHRLKKGEQGTGLALQSGHGRRKWDIPPEQAVALAAQFGADASKPDAKTPTQTIALVGPDLRAAFEQTVLAVTSRPSTGLKLIDAEDCLTSRAFAAT